MIDSNQVILAATPVLIVGFLAVEPVRTETELSVRFYSPF